MRRHPPRSTRTHTPFPYTTLFLSRRPAGRFRGRYQEGLRHDRPQTRRAGLVPALLFCGRGCVPRKKSPAEAGLFLKVQTRWVQPFFFARPRFDRSEEHTSELQSLMRISYDVFSLKQKNNNTK